MAAHTLLFLELGEVSFEVRAQLFQFPFDLLLLCKAEERIEDTLSVGRNPIPKGALVVCTPSQEDACRLRVAH